MNAAIIHHAVAKAHLHVPNSQGHNDRKFQPMAGISYRHNAIAGAANPAVLRRIKRHSEGAFSCLLSDTLALQGQFPIMAAGVGTLRSGRTLSPVLATRTSPPPKPLTEVADSATTAKESTMNASIKGTQPEICPSFILRAALEKRIRRELAKSGRKLLKSRPGTPAHREYGQYAIENGLRRVVAINHDLLLLAHELGVLKPGEQLKPKYDRISVMTYRHEEGDTDRIEHYVVGKPGAGKLLFDLLEGPFEELADAEEARNLMIGGRGHE